MSDENHWEVFEGKSPASFSITSIQEIDEMLTNARSPMFGISMPCDLQ
jgi:hypothetical protein